MICKLRLTGGQHAALRSHLFPGDGKEAVAIALCGRRAGTSQHVLTVRKVVPVPYEQCAVRTRRRLTWSTDLLTPLLQEAERRHLALVKIHSHPGWLAEFSEQDDHSDRDLFPSVYGWVDDDLPHASAVMLPDGQMFGRVVSQEGRFISLATVAVAGDDISFWHQAPTNGHASDILVSHQQLFGEGTLGRLRQLSVAVVGCSGTGSIVVEQLARLGVGKLTLVDPDRVERKNLNRILNATLEDAREKRFKVDVLARRIEEMGLGTVVQPLPLNLVDPAAVKAVAECDVAFGCMDGVEGRHVLNLLAVFYLVPYFDVGVRLEADGSGGIDEVCGTVHYLRPDQSSLLARGVYTLEELQAEALRRTDPEEYGERVKANYIKGIRVDRLAVISVNMQLASMAVNEFLARLHPYRYDPNADFTIHRVSLAQGVTYKESDPTPCRVLARHAGRGDVRPLLDMPELSDGGQDS
ncbi:MAG TPA: ThiF family adenylyltransferase [Gemmataceae bacterium]|nr:ThiF family adenylyltransferase [Gemmataceae bacterium]